MDLRSVLRTPMWLLASTPSSQLALSVVIIIVSTPAIIAIYRMYFHPLSKYPGPRAAAISNLVNHYVRIKGDQASWTLAMHQKYGEVVRLGPNVLSYTHPQAWKDIYGHHIGGRLENPKDPRTFPPDFNGEFSLITLPDAHEHNRLRRVFSVAFSDKALTLQEPLIKKYADQLVDNIRHSITTMPNEVFDIEKMYNFATFDIMGHLTFGEPLGLLEHSKYTPWVEAVFGRFRALIIMIMILEYPLAARLFRWFMPTKIKEQERMHFEHSAHRVDRRLARDSADDKPDIWSLVLDKEKDQLTVPKMHANASMFMAAGSDTTASLLSGLTFYLLKNPDELRKLIDEIRALRKEELTFEVLARLPYLNACIHEGLRVYPSIPNGFPRDIAPGGNVVCGDWLPEKTSVVVSQAAAYRSPLNFKDPNSFIPERWLPGSEYDSDRKDVLQPFSIGPRNCIGKNLAYHETRIILASVLWHFNLELSPWSTVWGTAQKTYLTWCKPELWVKGTLRQK